MAGVGQANVSSHAQTLLADQFITLMLSVQQHAARSCAHAAEAAQAEVVLVGANTQSGTRMSMSQYALAPTKYLQEECVGMGLSKAARHTYTPTCRQHGQHQACMGWLSAAGRVSCQCAWAACKPMPPPPVCRGTIKRRCVRLPLDCLAARCTATAHMGLPSRYNW
jgi:hypothetical protein